MFAIPTILPGFHEHARSVTILTDPLQFVNPDPRRAILYLANPTDEDLWMWFRMAFDPTLPPALVVAAHSTFRLTWSLDGPMTTFGWIGQFPTTPAAITFTEILWHPDQLSQSLAGVV